MRRRTIYFVALALTLVGYWLPWLTPAAAALQLNGYELSEWVTNLPGVRDGTLPISRLLFLLPLGCLAWLFGLAATWPAQHLPPLLTQTAAPTASARGGWGGLLPAVQGAFGWGLLLIGLFCAYVVLPPYPAILTAYGDPEYRAQFFLVGLGVVALLLSLYLPATAKATLQLILAAAGGSLGLWCWLVVRPPASALLGAPWAVGLGLPLMLLGFGLLAVGGLRELFGPRL